eukprot:2808835-Amphidinium_carterae.1
MRVLLQRHVTGNGAYAEAAIALLLVRQSASSYQCPCESKCTPDLCHRCLACCCWCEDGSRWHVVAAALALLHLRLSKLVRCVIQASSEEARARPEKPKNGQAPTGCGRDTHSRVRKRLMQRGHCACSVPLCQGALRKSNSSLGVVGKLVGKVEVVLAVEHLPFTEEAEDHPEVVITASWIEISYDAFCPRRHIRVKGHREGSSKHVSWTGTSCGRKAHALVAAAGCHLALHCFGACRTSTSRNKPELAK